jgi:16S rRNA (uracil1498-N3)-methyltransferase
MHYFFLEKPALTEGRQVTLAEEDLNHAFRVLRLKAGDQIVIADGLGRARLGRVTKSSSREILVMLHEQLSSAESPLKITLFQSLLKGDKMDLVIRQAVELGVHHIVPIVSARSIPRHDKKQDQKKALRWQSIIRSASAQCRRSFLAEVEPLCDFTSVLSRLKNIKTLVPWEEEQSIKLSEIFEQPCPSDGAVFLFVGPEGGFANDEIEALRKSGAETVTLGPRIMRSETAAAAAIVLIQAGWGDLSGKGEYR